MRRRKQAVVTRRLVPLSGQEPGPVDVGSHERSRVMLEQAFDDGNIIFKWGYFGFGSLWVPHLLNCFDHFAVDPAITPVRATGHQLVKREHRFWIHWWEVSISQCVIIDFRFLLFTVFLVHRIRCRSSAFGAECCTSWSTCCWHEWLERRLIRSKSSLSSCVVKAHIQDEEGVGGERSGSVLRHWGYWCSWQTEPFLLSGLSKRCLGVDAWSSWDLATLSGGETFCPWPTIETGDSWLAGFGFWRNPPQWKWAGAAKRAHPPRSSGSSGSRVSLCRGLNCGRIWSPGCDVTSCCESVVANWSSAIGRAVRNGEPIVVAVYADC